MKLTWIEDLLAIAESPSLTEAAARRYVTQPAFTRRLHAIEAYLGVTLLDRSHRPARPNPNVQASIDQLRRLSKDLRRLCRDLSTPTQVGIRQVVVACQHSLSVSFIPGLTRRVRDQVSDVSIRLRAGNLDECVWLLTTRQAAILLAYEADGQALMDGLSFVEKKNVLSDRLVPVATPSLAREFYCDDADVKVPVIAYPDDTFLGKISAEIINQSADLRNRIFRVAETGLSLAARQMGLAGLGVAWLPESLIRSDLRDGLLEVLSGDFGECGLSLLALRLDSPRSEEERIVWDGLTPKLNHR